MCGSCSAPTRRGRRWTTGHIVVLVLVGTLVVLSGARILLGPTGGNDTTRGCAHVTADETAYQAEISRDLRSGTPTLVRDTNSFIGRVYREGAGACDGVRSFVTGSQTTLAAACAPCAERLRRSLAGP